MTDRELALVLAFLGNAGLAVYVRWRFRTYRLHRVFSGMLAGVAAYSLFTIGLAVAPTASAAAQWVRVATLLPYLGLFGFYRFAVLFGRAEQRPWTGRLLKACGAAALVDVLARLAGLVPVHLARNGQQGWFPQQDLLYGAIYVPVMLLLVLSSVHLLGSRLRRSESPLERRQLGLVFLAMLQAMVVSLFNIHPSLAILGAFSPLLFGVLLTYGITRFELLDLKILLRQGALGALLSASLAFVLALTLLLSNRFIDDGSGLGNAVGLLLSALFFTLSYEPLRRVSGRLLDRWLDVRQVDVSAELLGYSQLAGRHPGIESFLQAVCVKLQQDHHFEHCSVLLPDAQGRLMPAAAAPPAALTQPLSISAEALAELGAERLGLDAEQLTWVKGFELGADQALSPVRRDLQATLQALGAQALYSLRGGDGRPLGLLAVGPAADGRGIQANERAFLAALATLLSGALENALLLGQVRHADRLQSLGAIAAGLAHELRNPLSSILVFVQMLPERFHDPVFREKFNRVVQQELGKLNRLTEQLLQISRPGGRAALPLDLEDQFERVAQLVAYQFRRKGVRLERACEGRPWVRGSADELGQVFLNLLLNALAVSDQGSRVSMSAQAEGGQALIQVTDEGPGLSPAQLERLFEPFFTTKADGNGLGLATSLKIIESFGGTMRAYNLEGAGACFEVRLPLAPARTGAAPGSDEPLSGEAGR